MNILLGVLNSLFHTFDADHTRKVIGKGESDCAGPTTNVQEWNGSEGLG